MHAATHAATSHWRNANHQSGGGGTTSGQTVAMHPAFTIIGMALAVLIGGVILMGINGPYEDRTAYFVAIGLASGVIVLALAYLIYRCVKQRRQKEDEPLTTDPTPDLETKASSMPMLP